MTRSMNQRLLQIYPDHRAWSAAGGKAKQLPAAGYGMISE